MDFLNRCLFMEKIWNFDIYTSLMLSRLFPVFGKIVKGKVQVYDFIFHRRIAKTDCFSRSSIVERDRFSRSISSGYQISTGIRNKEWCIGC